MKNAEWLLKQGIKFDDVYLTAPANYTYVLEDKTGRKLGSVDNSYSELSAFQKWLDMEHVEPVLTDEEREYIENVCRPFRYKVKCISKTVVNHMDDSTDYYLVIRFFNEYFAMFFPSFDGSAMYKGMEDNKWYTPMELGLYEDND